MKQFSIFFENESVNAVSKMLRETISGKMLWDVQSVVKQDSTSKERIVGHIYISKIDNNIVRLYQSIEPNKPMKYILELYEADLSGAPLWRFPNINMVRDLYRVVDNNHSKAIGVLRKYISDY